MATNATRARKPRMVVAEDTDDAPQVLSLVSKKNPDAPPMRDVFTIDGVMYQIRTTVPVNVGLRYVHLARTWSVEYANDFMLESLLGPVAYGALMAYGELTQEQLDAVVQIAQKIMLGRLENTPN